MVILEINVLHILFWLAFGLIVGTMVVLFLLESKKSHVAPSQGVFDLGVALRNPKGLAAFQETYQKNLAAHNKSQLRQTVRPGEHSGKIGTQFNVRKSIGVIARISPVVSPMSVTFQDVANKPVMGVDPKLASARASSPGKQQGDGYLPIDSSGLRMGKDSPPTMRLPSDPGGGQQPWSLLPTNLTPGLPTPNMGTFAEMQQPSTLPIGIQQAIGQPGMLVQSPIPGQPMMVPMQAVPSMGMLSPTGVPQQPVIPGQPAIQSATSVRSVGQAGAANTGVFRLMVEKLLAPVVVQQGDQDINASITIANWENIPCNIAAVGLKFYRDRQDVSDNYEVLANMDNPAQIQPGTKEQFFFSINIVKNAQLGRVYVAPFVMGVTPEQQNITGQQATNQIFQWRVEPMGRTFRVTTENSNVETAGVPFCITLEMIWNEKVDQEYNGLRKISFWLDNLPSDNPNQVPKTLDVTFQNGIARTGKHFCLFNTVETYILNAKDETPGGGEGSTLNIILQPNELETFRVEISSPQRNNINLEGENTVTALDAYGNIKSDYHMDTLFNSEQASIKGLVDFKIPSAAFQQGIANLTSLNIRICIPEFEQEGKIVRLKARIGNKSGYSNDVVVLPATVASPSEMSVSVTQFTVKRYCQHRRKHLWLSTVDSTLTHDFENNFQKDYDLVIKSITPATIKDCAAYHPDVLFLDVENKMPDDGYQIMREIRQLQGMDNVPIFIIGPSAESEERISEVLRTGCVYVTKPVAMSPLRAEVADLLQNIPVGSDQLPVRGARIQGSEGQQYQIVNKMCEGGMGYIYEAKRVRDQRRVIIKYLPPGDVKKIKPVLRFIQEAHTVMVFNHENLVSGYDLLLDRNRCFYVMEFIEGRTVEKMIQQERRIAPDKAVDIVCQVARGLQYLDNEHHLVHRDIKPSNILVMNDGLTKLVDFGIAKLNNHNLTTVGIILGTPYYLAPEQITGQEITIQSDIYSLGATFYHMVTGTHPFQGNDVYTIVHQRLNRDPLDPRQYANSLPASVAKVIMKMMSLKPNHRYAPVSTLIEELEKISADMRMVPQTF